MNDSLAPTLTAIQAGMTRPGGCSEVTQEPMVCVSTEISLL